MNFDKETAQSLKEALAGAFEAAKAAADGIKSAVDGMTPEQIQNIMEKAAENKEDAITLSPYDEPIEVAQKLILAVYEDEPSAIEKAMGCTKPTLRAYYSPHELRQIAQHLLVYCDSETAENE